MNLTKRFILTILLLVIVPLAISSYLALNSMRDSIFEQNAQYLESIAEIQANRVNATLDRYIDWAELISSRTRLRVLLADRQSNNSDATEEINNIVTDALRSNASLIAIEILDATGAAVIRTGTETKHDEVTRKQIVEQAAQGSQIFDLTKDQANTLSLEVVSPLILDGEFIGAAHISARADNLINITDDYTGLGNTGEVILARKNANGDALFLTPLRFNTGASLSHAISNARKDSPMVNAVSGIEKTFTSGRDYRNNEVIAVSKFIPATQWGVVAKMDKAEVLKAVAALEKKLLINAAIVLLTTISVSFLVVRSIMRPIGQLHASTLKLAEGNFDVEIPSELLKSKNEVGAFAATFAKMADELRRLYKDLELKVQQRTKELENTKINLEKTVARFKNAEQAARIGSFEINLKTGSAIWSEEMSKLHGNAVENNRSTLQQMLQYMNTSDQRRFVTEIKRALHADGKVNCEVSLVSKDSKTIHIRVNGIISQQNDETIFTGSYLDITEEKVAQQNLIKFKLAVDNATEGIVITSADLQVVYANKALEALLGKTFAEIQSEDFSSAIIHEKTDPTTLLSLKESLKQGLAFHSDDLLIRQGSQQDFFLGELSLFPVSESNTTSFYVAIIQDVTKRKEVDKAKSEFVSLASHQLRTPLTSINWYTEMLLSGDTGHMNEDQMKYVQEVSVASQRMSDLVNSLLNVSRLELGTFAVDPKPVDVIVIAKEVVKELEPKVFSKKQNLIENYQWDTRTLNYDPSLFRMMVQNTLSNAIKYTPDEGKIELKIAENDGWLQISVKDTGYGIPLQSQSKIFSKLYRADNIQEIDTTGSGLGLYIIKSIVDYVGGKIWFESPYTDTDTANVATKTIKGTAFYINLPLAGMDHKDGSKPLNS